jgi:hypothetical protein
MNLPDAKWLSAIIEASGPKTTALALASAAVVFGRRYDVLGLSDLPRLVVQVATVTMILFGSLSLISTVVASWRAGHAGVSSVLAERRKRRSREAAEQAVRDYLPHLTEKERQIIGFLLAKNQKTFTATPDGGYARTLLARRLVLIIGQPGHEFDYYNVPMAVPDHVWKIFEENSDQFPYRPEYRGDGRRKTEVAPWREPSI